MAKHLELGALGEEKAAEYLTERGYTIIDRNARKPWGEIDIVAQAPNKTLVFVEVKTLRQAQGKPLSEQLKPEDQMTASKIRKSKIAAQLYAGHKPELVNERGWRIDLVAITKVGEGFKINHYENVVG